MKIKIKIKKDSLIEYAENNFQCVIGEPRTFFEVEGRSKIVVYVAYAARGKDPVALDEWMLDKVFKPLWLAGGRYLWWRLPERIERILGGSGRNIDYSIYTRIAVLDEEFSDVTIPDMIKPEGIVSRRLDNDSSEEVDSS